MSLKKKAKIERESFSVPLMFSSHMDCLKRLSDLEHGICLVGPACSGKSSLFRALSQWKGQEMLTVYMDSSVDSKNLIGTYVCSEVPGEFIWKTGILAHAAQTGAWVLFENLDRMSEDILTLLSNTLLTRLIQVPNKTEPIIPANGFKILGTATCPIPQNSAWVQLNIQQIDFQSFKEIVKPPVSNGGLVEDMLLRVHVEIDKLSGRKLIINDWKKFVARAGFQIEKIYGKAVPASLTERCRENILLEALAVYSSLRDREDSLKQISEVLNLNLSMCQALVENRKIQVKTSPHSLQVGISPEIQTTHLNSLNFSINSYSARLLETLCSAVSFNENVLLIGETGCGKTSIIQYLATFTNKKLYVHNLSQTSDPTDIVGGFKPVALSSVMLPLLTTFVKEAYKVEDSEHLATMSAKQLFAAGKWGKFLKSLEYSLESLSFEVEIKEKILDLIENCKKRMKNSQFAFHFEEGSLVKALKEGSWVLLEEINLAEDEVLERLYSVLEGQGLTLIEKGETHSILPSPGFRLFGCMNPGKQVGKKDLPSSLRCKFSEFFVPDMEKFDDLMEVINFYLNGKTDRKTMEKIANFYIQMRKMSRQGLIEDGNGRPPCYTLRTLCRALKYSVAFAGHYSFPHSLYNGLKVFFETPLKTSISSVLDPLAPGASARPNCNLESTHINVLGYFHEKGANPSTDSSFILTPSVKANLQALSRAVIYSNNAILLEGPTSSGKTSMVKYLSELLGHEFVRINNHEHTDIEEYIGSYVSDNSGRLVFCEGPLVKAVKNGYFLVLDELNLAPSEVLEALNRLLDDNQELFIPETQTTITPHKNFRLFATQNPTAYAGRKELSKAFRNRFVEMFIPELPDDELVTILQIKGKMAPSYANVLIQIMRDLQRHRQQTRAFMGRYGFITIRDLLKIAKREPVGYEELAHFTFILLAERLRSQEEKSMIQSTIEKHCKSVKLNLPLFYNNYFSHHFNRKDCGIIWNFHMKRLFTLVHSAVLNNEPVLLVGETGCGKTSICSALAMHNNKLLRTLNCHQHTETSDFLGSLRPVRAKGLLISQFFQDLQDITGIEFEISENSLREVLEKVKTGELKINEKQQVLDKGKKCLKLFEWVDGPLVQSFLSGDYFLIDEISLADDSVLERLNSVLEAERKLLIPEKPSEDHLEIQASPGFAIFATMNPGGDYGKKELSPALRNRFTEIWVSLTPEDMSEILKARLSNPEDLIDFIQVYNSSKTTKVPLSLRDAITCADFIKRVPNRFQEALALVLPKNEMKKWFEMFGKDLNQEKVVYFDGMIGIHPFFIPCINPIVKNYSFDGPNIKNNLYCLLRALQMPKAVLLEGPPGVGKTSIVEALARVVGIDVVRINLSEETDLIDLLGCDLPVGEKFEWCDGVLLDALKTGKWVILDELNLCPQQVIEGLNALLDHRSQVYIPEINLEVKCSSTFKIFGAQNPVNQGGGRKGLPKSFLNRFTKIYMDELLSDDYEKILSDLFPHPSNKKTVEFSEKLKTRLKGPWEFNLRDILREKQGARISTLYFTRLRTADQRSVFHSTFSEVYNSSTDLKIPFFYLTPNYFFINNSKFPSSSFPKTCEMIPNQIFLLDRILEVSSFSWPVLLVGPSGSGKSTLVRIAASLSGTSTFEFSLSSNSDSSTLLGSFEQTEQGQFAWFDSFLLRSVQQGGWVLLKNCNKCNAAVLDRINSLLEPGGSLLVNERGLVDGKSYVVRPHPNFRIFFSYDPAFGEVSRALRNRCVEIFVEGKFSFFEFNRIFSVSLEEFSCVGKMTIAQAALCKQLQTVMNREEALKIAYGLEEGNWEECDLKVNGLRFLQSIEKFLEDPVKAYFLEDLGFCSENSTQEAKECFLSGSCHFDVKKRCEAVGCETIEHLLPSCDLFLPVLNLENSLFHYLSVSNQVYPRQSLKPLKNPLKPLTLEDLKHFWLLNRSSSELLCWKIMKKLDDSSNPPLPKGLLTSYKSRRSSNPLPVLGAGPLLVTEREFALMLSGKAAESQEARSFVKVIDEDSNELIVPVLSNKQSFQSEERKFLEEIFEIYEQVLFKHLLQCLQDLKISVIFLKNLTFFPSSYLKAIWMIQKGFSMKEVILPILKTSDGISQDFLAIFQGMKQTSVLEAPKFWTLCNNILAWPKVPQRVCLPEKYVSELKDELRRCCLSDEKIEKVAGRSQAASLGLWLYKLYVQMNKDPDALYWDLNRDYCQIVSLIQKNIDTRIGFHDFRMGFKWENSLVVFYRETLKCFYDKSIRLAPSLRPVHPESEKFLNYLSSLPSYSRLSNLLIQEQTSTSQKFLTDLLSSLISSSSSFTSPLSLPLLESLYLMLFGLHSESLKPDELFSYPIPLSSYNDHLITSHLFSSTDFLKNLITSVLKQTKSKDSSSMHLKQIPRYSSEHNIGEKTSEENEKEKNLKESKQIQKIFPTFKDEALWNQVCSKEKQVIVDLFIDWQFACGRLENQLESRFFHSLPYNFPGCYLQKPLEVHLKSLMRKYEEPVINFNFYKDPNPHESMQAYSPLVSLLKRMTEISQEFPDHAVIQEIQYLAYKALKRPIFSTPLMQMTGILEVVVLKTEDWEKFAHSGVSVKKEINEIYAVLKRWRELQIKSWENVLEETRQQAFEKEAKLWARLVRVFYLQKVNGKELFDVLDEFIRGSSLGVFQFRLEMLRDFMKVIPSDQVLPVYHIIAFYSSFTVQFKSFFDEQYKEIDERLKEIVQIAKFKMSNYLLWKDSVSKVHKQLNALVVKYKTVLKLPFEVHVLQKHRNSYQVNILEQPLKVQDQFSEDSDFESLSLQIIKKLEELKQFPGKNEKKIALNELFKELHDRGFSKYYKQSDLKVFDLPRFDLYESITDLSSHERYFYSCIDKMTVLQFTQTISQDLLYEEKESCLGLANSLMTELFKLRTKLNLELSSFKVHLSTPASLTPLVSEVSNFLKSEEFRQFQQNLDSKQSSTFKTPVLSGEISDLTTLERSLASLLNHPSLPSSLQDQLLTYNTKISSLLSSSEIINLLSLKINTFHSTSLSTYRSLGKLTHILLSIFISLFTQGFCIPPELQDPDDNDQNGTGLGEGRGEKNITNELEDEEQFGEQKDKENNENPENSSEISEENQAMDVENDFQEDQKEDLQEEQSGDDKLEEAKGNEQLMDEDNSMDVDENSEACVRETANPDLTQPPDMKAGEMPQDRTGDVEDVEDFDMQGKESSDEEMKEEDSEEILDVDKRSQDDSLEEDSEASEGSEKEEKEGNEENEEKEEKNDSNHEENKKDEQESEEEKKLDEFKNREQVKYDSQAQGNEDLQANTQKMLEGHENSGKQGETQNIISKLKSEWSESKGPSEIGPKSCQSNNEALNKVQVINSSEDFKRPETSDLYTFTETSLETAPAASSEPNNSNLPEHLENPSKSETQILDCNEDLLNSSPQSKPEVSQPSKEPEKPSSLSTFLQFQEGSRSSGKQPVLSTSSIQSEINENFEILPQTPPEAYEIEAWQDLERETSSISSELCEQLRILLEPTKAKSLKGDYKTGKRINMKKVIAYIASSYRKDKIWLRRTRQTAREYQVLIAIDDSFSMKQNGLGPVATKGLAALAQALNKLEVGQLAVAAIREGLSVLHDFSNFFLPEDGAFVLNQLNFAYGRDKANDNCYANFVNQTQSFLRSRGNNEMQLVVVISDGRMNKDKVRPCLRKSDGIFYLFVIVDNQDSSVFDMKSTVISKKDGKSSVKVFPYLEDFPFEFYVVVQSTDLLVHVLADVVRQWFELIRN